MPKISRHIFTRLSSNRKDIHGRYQKTNIKNYEIHLQGEEDLHYVIRRESYRPADFGKLLKRPNF